MYKHTKEAKRVKVNKRGLGQIGATTLCYKEAKATVDIKDVAEYY